MYRYAPVAAYPSTVRTVPVATVLELLYGAALKLYRWLAPRGVSFGLRSAEFATMKSGVQIGRQIDLYQVIRGFRDNEIRPEKEGETTS